MNNTIYNNKLGYREGYRLSSSGVEKVQEGAVNTGFIPAKRGQSIQMSGAEWGTSVNEGYSYIIFYDKDFNKIYTVNKYQQSTVNNNISNVSPSTVDKTASSIITENGVTTFNIVTTDNKEYSYIRISATGKGQDLVVAVGQNIV
mgnify:CR=1 FL=1